MTDQPGRSEADEERLPAPVPTSAPVTSERFSAPPSAHRNDLTPERAAKIVRQSGSARWVGFIAITIVALFVIAYYFYELGLPGGLSRSRLDVAADEQQVVSVERGYNIYQANCAQCHGVDGEGGKGPTLNRQDKLFAHLNPDYLHNVLTVGGRYVCGDPNSIMPIWSNEGNPPGPLNYKQVEDVINFIRAENTHTFRVMDPSLFEPVIDPETGEEKTFKGWVDPTYEPAPDATPYPACWTDEFTNASPAPSGSEAPSGSAEAPSGSAEAPSGSATPGDQVTVVEEAALNIQFVNKDLKAPADTGFQIKFENQDAGIPHNIDIKDPTGADFFVGKIFPGVATETYDIPAMAAGTYNFICTVHPTMTGTITAGS